MCRIPAVAADAVHRDAVEADRHEPLAVPGDRLEVLVRPGRPPRWSGGSGHRARLYRFTATPGFMPARSRSVDARAPPTVAIGGADRCFTRAVDRKPASSPWPPSAAPASPIRPRSARFGARSGSRDRFCGPLRRSIRCDQRCGGMLAAVAEHGPRRPCQFPGGAVALDCCPACRQRRADWSRPQHPMQLPRHARLAGRELHCPPGASGGPGTTGCPVAADSGSSCRERTAGRDRVDDQERPILGRSA